MKPDRNHETTVVMSRGTFFGVPETDILALEVEAAADVEATAPPPRPETR